MKPIKLIFQGFNSFSDRTEIDFERLQSNGLFGIFGKTGSGKSTILDCIMYALFGKASRGAQKIKEYVNDKSTSAFVDFTFEVFTAGERKTYNVKRTIKITKRGDAETTASLSVWQDDAFAPMDGDVSGRIKDIIGIGYEEFSKCIILPQNEFAAFVKATKTTRLEHVRKLFDLERYDVLLLGELKKRTNEITVQLAAIEGESKQYERFTDEYVNSLKAAEISQKQRISALKERRVALENEVKAGEETYSLKLQYGKAVKELAALEGKKTYVEGLKIKIERRNSAVKVMEALSAYTSARDALVKIKEETARTSAVSKNLAAELESTAKENKRDRQGEIDLLTENIAKLQANSSVVDDIEKLRVEYRAALDKKAAVSRSISTLLRDKEGLLARLAGLGDPQAELDRLFEEVGSSVLKGELKAQAEYFLQRERELEAYRGDGLYPVVRKEIERKLDEISARLSAVGSVRSDAAELSESLNLIRKRSEEISALKDKISACEAKLATENKQLEMLALEEQRLSMEGEVKREILRKLSEEVGADVSGRAKFNALSDKLSADATRLKKELTAYIAKEKQLLLQIADVGASLAALSEKLSLAEANCKEREAEYATALKEGGFEDREQVAACALDEKTFSEYNLKIENFENEYNSALALKVSLETRLSGVQFDADAYLERKAELDSTVSVLGSEEGELKVVLRDIAEAERMLAEMKGVMERKAETGKRLSLCEQLAQVLANHKLLNFIAEEYLSEISYSASRTLLMLTGGRYDLVYDEAFYVNDNFNCGERRNVTTLSGGETFLVSLSLALALSQAICEKTMRPVEFFFLDEGFGTLDADLTDVVISSLERLKSENFAIGLISHVPELKQRLQCKIIVTPASATEGSKIEAIY